MDAFRADSELATLSTPPEPARSRLGWVAGERAHGAMLLAWCAIVLLCIVRHEFWRDEVRALSFAVDAGSLSELAGFMKDEGHPMLWHVLLYAAYGLTASKLALPVTSFLISAAAVALFVFEAPFPKWLKALFVFGGLPLYEYSVMARNYGISMLLFFTFAHLYRSRNRRPLLLGVILALLCNTNVHSLLLAGLLTAFWTWQLLVRERAPLFGRQAALLYGAIAIMLAGAAVALMTLWPTDQMAVSDSAHYTTASVLRALWITLTDPANAFQKIAPRMPGILTLVADLLLVSSTLVLIVEPLALVASWVALFILSVLFLVVYPGDYRHQGLFVVFVLTLLWMVLAQGERPQRDWVRRVARLGYVGLSGILGLLVVTGGYKVYVDLGQQKSAAKEFGAFLNERPEYADAILIGEPDFYLESIPYYAANSIYLVREHRFGDTVKFVRSAQRQLGMRQLLSAAWDVHVRTHRQVLLALGHTDDLDPSVPSRTTVRAVWYSFGRIFWWSPDGLRAWNASTRPVRTFADGVSGDERYRVYELVSAPD